MTRRIRVLCGLLPVLAFTVAATLLPAGASARSHHHHARHHHRNATRQSDASVQRALSPYKTRLTVDIIYLVSQRNPPSAKQAAGVDSRLAGIQRDLSNVQRIAQRQRPSSAKTRRALSDIERALSYVYAAAGQDRAACADVRRHRMGPARKAIRAATTDLTRAIPLLQSGGRTLHLFG